MWGYDENGFWFTNGMTLPPPPARGFPMAVEDHSHGQIDTGTKMHNNQIEK